MLSRYGHLHLPQARGDQDAGAEEVSDKKKSKEVRVRELKMSTVFWFLFRCSIFLFSSFKRLVLNKKNMLLFNVYIKAVFRIRIHGA